LIAVRGIVEGVGVQIPNFYLSIFIYSVSLATRLLKGKKKLFNKIKQTLSNKKE
jgi:hypothetical protein